MQKIRIIKNEKYYFIFTIILFLFLPFFSILFQLFFISVFNLNRKYFIRLLIITISLYIGLINATKLPETDLEVYLSWYQTAGELPLGQFLFKTSKAEPLFDVLTYILNFLFRGSEFLYILFLTFIIYNFFLRAVYKFYNYYKSEGYIIVLAIVLASFLPQLFSVSSNIIRQLLASSLIFYFLINRIFYKKNYWIILVISIFTHTSVSFLLPFVFIDLFVKSFKLKKMLGFLILAIPITSLLINFYKSIFNFLINFVEFPFLAYAFLRILKPSRDILYEPPGVKVVILVLLLLMFILYHVILNIKGVIVSKPYVYFSIVYLGFVVVFFATFNLTEISHRLLYYTYYFIPFIFPALIVKKNTILNRLVSSGVILFVLMYFIIKLDTSVWTYAPKIHLFGDLLLYHFYQ